MIAGGPIPREDFVELRQLGIEGIFPPGSTIEAIVKFIRSHVPKTDAAAAYSKARSTAPAE